MYTYTNGNATINLTSDGTRTIEFEGELKLEYPLNIDIRVQTYCPLGYNPTTGKAVCSFCHESASTTGTECDYTALLAKLDGLPKGIELAIGCNVFTPGLFDFLKSCTERDFVCNLTINQLSLRNTNNTYKKLHTAIENGYIKGLGISYRQSPMEVHQDFLDYENTVVHVIAGIDDIHQVMKLPVKKILVLGEKDFGFNEGKVDLTSQNHKEWFWNIRKTFDIFDVVSFDNLALEQLKIKRFLPQKEYDKFYQGEYSFYINAVDKYYSRSSRSHETTPWHLSIPEYFKSLDLT